MLWKRSSLVILAGATVFVWSLLNAPPCENVDLLRDQPPITAKHLQAKSTGSPESNFAMVAFQDSENDMGDRIGEAFFNGLKISPAKDEATHLRSEPQVAPATNEGSAFDRQGELYETRNPAWQANPLFEENVVDDEAADPTIVPLPAPFIEESTNEWTTRLRDELTEQLPEPLNEHLADQPTDQSAKQSTNAPITQSADDASAGMMDQSILVKPETDFVAVAAVPSANHVPIEPVRCYVPEGVAYKAALRIEYGKSLSRRGAAFAARQEFLYALNLIAQALDSQSTDNYHTTALHNAVVAISEVGDFFEGSSETQIGMNVAKVVTKHSSQIVSPEEAGTMTRAHVVQRYLVYAENQFAIAGGQHVVASEAFYSLGKLRTVMAEHSRNPDQLDIAKAIMFHRDALACDANNFRSAHELGVVLANNGQLEDAKEMIKHSLMVQQTPEAWANLATIHERLGEFQFADLAKKEYAVVVQNPKNSIPGENGWVPPQQFNASVSMDLYEATAKKPETATTDSNKVGEDEQPAKLMNKIKSWF